MRTPETRDIGKDMWKQLKRVSIPTFDGDKKAYEALKAAFIACIDQAPATGEYKLLQLRQYLTGEALRAIDGLGHSEFAYEAAKERLERKFGGTRRKILKYVADLDEFIPIREDHPRDVEKFADLLDVAIINLKEARRNEELGNGIFYHKLQKKLPEKMLTRYKRWVAEQHHLENVEVLKKFIIEEAEYQIAATETLHGLQPRRKHNNNNPSFFVKKEPKKFNQCAVCHESHRLWECQKFKGKSTTERWQIAKQNRICFRCLSGTHFAKECRNSRICGIDGCTDTHNKLLHQEVNNVSSEAEKRSPKANVPAIQSSHTSTAYKQSRVEYVSLRTVTVILKNGSKKIIVNALLDDGSTKTYLNSDDASELELDGQRENITVEKVNGQSEALETTPVRFELESLDGKVKSEIEAYTMKRVTGNLKPINWSLKAKKWKHLRNIPFPNIGPKQIVDILIGVDYADLHCAHQEVKGGRNEPVARLTPLGWTCIGGGETQLVSHFLTTKEKEKDLLDANNTIKKLWEIEDEDLSFPQQFLSSDENEAITTVKESLRRVNDRYEVKLPWKDKKNLENNYSSAVNRLKSTEKKLLRDKELGEQYSDIIRKYVEKGYLEKIDANKNDENCWFLPHFPVIRPEKATTKVRIVFDGAAKFNGTCLNDCIHQGPKLQQDLVKVLLRFRRFPVALACDIAEMYLQIGIHEEDRKYQRILWRSLKTDEEPTIFQFKRMVFGINASPFEAQFVAQEHARNNKDCLPIAAESVLESTYMDDTMDSTRDDHEGEQLYCQLNELWTSAGMNARKWLSNSKVLMEKIPLEDRAEQIDLDSRELPAIKTLGVVWNAEEDIFTYKSVVEDLNICFTKRLLLKKMATLFDPLGFLSPFVTRIKILMQELWLQGLDWDDEIVGDSNKQIIQWFEELKDLPEIQVPRCLQEPDEPIKRQIHVFTDASNAAYGAVAYQNCVYANNVSTSRFIMAKSRVSPLKSTSIPRLELLGAVLGLKMAKKISSALQLELKDVVFWSDSMNVLWWIRNQSRKLKPFVANRISLIQSDTLPQQWRYVPTKKNPADLVTRGSSLKDLAKDDAWWKGPEFILEGIESWPKNRFEATDESKKEVKKSSMYTTMVLIHSAELIDVSRFSSLQRAVAVMGWTKRFLQNCRLREEERFQGELNQMELQDAEQVLIKKAQIESFEKEIQCLSRVQPIPVSSKISSLLPQLDEDGILRANGRLQNAEYLSYDVKYPVILPRDHYVTKLIVKKYHEDGCHAMGTNHLFSKLSEKFWIIRAREVIRKIENECGKCKKMKAKVALQVMAPLPSIRLKEPLRAFSRVGVDFGGPFVTIQGRSRRRAKRYLCLFTCLLSRAVHLELAYSLDTDSFLNAFYRMTNRRGVPSEVLSDNGTNFVGANNELKELVTKLDKEKITKSTANKGIKWTFNVPLGSHHGGVFETMIKAAKRATFKILGNSDINDEELHSAFTGAESLLNSRPLTYQSSDYRDDLPITPNHLLIGMVGERFAPESIDKQPFHPKRRWRRVQELVQHFWKRWIKEWLPTLNRRNKWTKEFKDLQEGDFVIVISQDTPRGQWPLGRITKTYPGKDGHVRVAKVKIGNKEYTRPISKLCPLEII